LQKGGWLRNLGAYKGGRRVIEPTYVSYAEVLQPGNMFVDE